MVRRLVSPSQLKQAAICPRAWILDKIYGIKDTSKSAAAILGTAVHQCVGAHIEGRSVYQPHFDTRHVAEQQQFEAESGMDTLLNLLARAPRIALPVVHQLPDVPLRHVQVEQRLTHIGTALDRHYKGNAPYGIEPMSAIDLRVDPGPETGAWLGDIKSTRSLDAYVPSQDKLAADVQLNIYALDCAERWGYADAERVPWGWIYTRTEGAPLTRVIRGETSRLDALAHLTAPLDPAGEYAGAAGQSWLALAEQLILWREQKDVLLSTPIADLPISPLAGCGDYKLDPCKAFGGCKKHPSRGGACVPTQGVLPLSALLSQRGKQKETKMINQTLLDKIRKSSEAAKAFRPAETQQSVVETVAEPAPEEAQAPAPNWREQVAAEKAASEAAAEKPKRAPRKAKASEAAVETPAPADAPYATYLASVVALAQRTTAITSRAVDEQRYDVAAYVVALQKALVGFLSETEFYPVWDDGEKSPGASE